ncbi:hypothetical protein J6590_105639, partial [Homalodisca vitripennis]
MIAHYRIHSPTALYTALQYLMATCALHHRWVNDRPPQNSQPHCSTYCLTIPDGNMCTSPLRWVNDRPPQSANWRRKFSLFVDGPRSRRDGTH